MATRRLRARWASESFGTAGLLSPSATTVLGHSPSGSAVRSAAVTASARFRESVLLCAVVPVLSVWPVTVSGTGPAARRSATAAAMDRPAPGVSSALSSRNRTSVSRLMSTRSADRRVRTATSSRSVYESRAAVNAGAADAGSSGCCTCPVLVRSAGGAGTTPSTIGTSVKTPAYGSITDSRCTPAGTPPKTACSGRVSPTSNRTVPVQTQPLPSRCRETT
ncbi:hypothetical protein GCM10020358_83740 [Amorphoplanes nipponensis]